MDPVYLSRAQLFALRPGDSPNGRSEYKMAAMLFRWRRIAVGKSAGPGQIESGIIAIFRGISDMICLIAFQPHLSEAIQIAFSGALCRFCEHSGANSQVLGSQAP
jgi:hypothetical protein